MAISDYCQTSDFSVLIPNADSALLSSCITAISRFIDSACGRHFYILTETTRYYDFSPYVLIDDLLSVDSIILETLEGETVTASQTLTTAEYVLEKFNHNEDRYNSLRVLSGTGDRIKITGTWGFDSSVPDPVIQTAIFATRILYSQMIDKGLKSESIKDYSVSYANFEHQPITNFIDTMLARYKK